MLPSKSMCYNQLPRMAKKKTAAGADIDRYLISIDRLKKFGAVVVVLLPAAGRLYS